MNYSPNMVPQVPHYVTLSRSALVESADSRFMEQQSLHFSKAPPINKRYSSQPHLNRNVLDYDTKPIIKPKPNLVPQPPPKAPKPKYQQPVSQQELENSEYLFPDLPPPPDALLDNTTSENSMQQNSRCSSLDDLNWVTSAAEMSRIQQKQSNIIGFHQRKNR